MLTTMYIVNNEPIDLAQVILPNYIEARDAGLGFGNKAIMLQTYGSLIANGVAAVLSAYPSAKATELRHQAATWCHELGTWGGSRQGAGRPRLASNTVECTIVLPADLAAKAERLGSGNRSAGVRKAIEEAVE